MFDVAAGGLSEPAIKCDGWGAGGKHYGDHYLDVHHIGLIRGDDRLDVYHCVYVYIHVKILSEPDIDKGDDAVDQFCYPTEFD